MFRTEPYIEHIREARVFRSTNLCAFINDDKIYKAYIEDKVVQVDSSAAENGQRHEASCSSSSPYHRDGYT